jgi:hypothetical protein
MNTQRMEELTCARKTQNEKIDAVADFLNVPREEIIASNTLDLCSRLRECVKAMGWDEFTKRVPEDDGKKICQLVSDLRSINNFMVEEAPEGLPMEGYVDSMARMVTFYYRWAD